MKKLEILLIALLLIVFYSQSTLIASVSKETLMFWFEQLLPSMFLSIFLIQLLSSTSFFSSVGSLLSFLSAPLNMNQEASGFVISCLFIGAPGSVSLIEQAFHDQRITESEAKRLLYCTPVSTISFLIMSVGVSMLHHPAAGMVLWLIQILSCLILCWLTKAHPITMSPLLASKKKHSMTSALQKTGFILFLILGYLMMFQTLSSMIKPLLPDVLQTPFQIISEFSYGCSLIAQHVPFEKAFPLISALCGFNGLCVQFQCLSLSEIRLHPVHYFFYRVVQSAIAFVISITVLPLLHG